MERKQLGFISLWFCTVLLVMGWCGFACAEKHWVEMGTDTTTAGVMGLSRAGINPNGLVTDYGAGEWYVFNVDSQNTSYATTIQTCETDAWYTLTVKNNGVAMTGWNISGGLCLYLADENHEWLLENVSLDKEETTFRLRIEPGDPITLIFVAYNNSTGVVSFEIVSEEDAAGEEMEAALEKTAGEISAQTMAVPRDQDWYLIPASADGGTLSVYIENRINEELSLEIYDEFKEQLVKRTCPYAQVTTATHTCEPGVAYYVKVSNEQGKQTGRYFFGWCDGEKHALEEQRVVTEPTCTQEGVSGQLCTICGTVMSAQPIAKLGHMADPEMTEVEPTCVAEGISRVRCTVCNDVLEEKALPMIAHQYGNWAEIDEPSLFEEGEEMRTCAACGDVQRRPVPKLNIWQSIFGR